MNLNKYQSRTSSNQPVLIDEIGIFSDLEPKKSSSSSTFEQTNTGRIPSGSQSSSKSFNRLALINQDHSNRFNNHSHNHQAQRANSSAMLNPNFEDSTNIQIESNYANLISTRANRSESIDPAGLQSSSFDDHCHVSVNLDKDRNKTVWYKLITVFILCILFMIGEIVGGILASSISIQTDAAHMGADIAGFFFSILAIYVSEKGVYIVLHNFFF